MAGEVTPSVGSFHAAPGLTIGHFQQHAVDNLFSGVLDTEEVGGLVTPFSLLSSKFPKKSEQDIRGELTRFGLSPKQSATNVRFLSGGERCRLCMTDMMLKCPDLLILDEITNHLDCESVAALIYGLRKWNGTLVMVRTIMLCKPVLQLLLMLKGGVSLSLYMPAHSGEPRC